MMGTKHSVLWSLTILLLCTGTALGRAPGRSERLWTEASAKKLDAQRSELSRVARRALPAVVSITTEQAWDEQPRDEAAAEATAREPSLELEDSAPPNPGADPAEPLPRGLGAGFIIRSDGFILTASHVVENARAIRVTTVDESGLATEYVAKLVGQDAATDCALLKINAPHPLPVLPLASVDEVEIADWVVAIGNPFGLSHSVSVGVVSFKGRADVTPNGRVPPFDYLQTDASINPGSSGGPVLDLRGNVVAVANAVNVSGQGIAFAVPIDIAKAVLPQLLTEGRFRAGWMGATVEDSPLRPGVRVTRVVEGGPADAAGLREGDFITAFGERPVRRARALRWEVATQGRGKWAAFQVVRRGSPKPLTLKVHLEEATELADSSRPSPDLLGQVQTSRPMPAGERDFQ